MTVIGITGPRKLSTAQKAWAREQLSQLLSSASHLHVGDANGLDALAIDVAAELGLPCTVHHSQGRQPWQLAKRSKRMVDAVVEAGGALISWPNKPCPEGLTVNSWKGSGTWGTTRYAVKRGLEVQLRPLVRVVLPEWLEAKQLALH